MRFYQLSEVTNLKFRQTMKSNHRHFKKTALFLGYPRGFALIVTLSLMILLTVIAVGLLTLSSITLRSSAQGNAMATAQANARLALMMAIGELQSSAGIDQRITAPAGVLGSTTGQQMITGVWKSTKLGPTSTPIDFSKTTKTDKFVRWLVSGAETDLKNEGYVANKLPVDKKTIVDLVSAANLDTGAPIVQAKKVEIKGSGPNSAITTGKLAYAVLDEGTKARTNLGVKKPTSDFAGTSTALGSGQRPNLSSIANIGTLAAVAVDLDTAPGRALTEKIISLNTSEFAYNSPPGKMKFKLHDLTANSQGLLVDVANGGLKKDFNLLAEETQKTGKLPSTYQQSASVSKGIYSESFGQTIVSDPPWARAIGWSNIFNNPALTKQTVGSLSVPTITAVAPPGWVAGTGKVSGGTNAAAAALSLVEPQGPVLLPSVAKIQMSFALAARDIYEYPDPTGGKGFPPVPKDGPNAAKGGNRLFHGYWDRQFQENIQIPVPPNATNDQKSALRTFDSPYDYLLHMIYSPIITLHNPYNVPLKFANLRVEFVNVPFAFQVFKNDGAGFKAQSTAPVPFSTMYSNSVSGGQSKRFGLTLSDTMLPGEVKVYSPNINPGQSWRAERRAGANMVFWDYGNSNVDDKRTGGTTTDTSKSVGIPGWNGPSVGYDLDFLAGGKPISPSTETVGAAKIERGKGIPVKADSEIYVESTPLADPQLAEKKFSVEMTLNYNASGPAADKLKRVSVLAFEFSQPDDLKNTIVGKDNPQAENFKIRAPKGTDAWTGQNLFDHSLVTLKNIKNTEPFALFSAYAKTTASGSGTDGEDGLWVAKPFSFQNHTSVAITQKVNQDPSKGHPSHYSHELALTRFPEAGINVQSTSKRGNFITGQSDLTGRRIATIYEVPLAPLQNFSTLNSAQLAAGTYLPHFSAPIGNSNAHPLLSSSSVLQTGPAGYQYADHSFLLNAALFDSYYFSGLQSRALSTKDGDGVTRDQLVDDFLASSVSGSLTPNPLTDQRIKPYLADGITTPEVATRLKANDAYAKAAAYQVLDGAFNVNSISVNAWKAVLSSMTGENAITLVTPGSDIDSKSLSKENVKPVTDTKGARFSRFRIPNGQPDRTGSDGFWRGSIDLSDAQLTNLATEIVKQVQARGPFLSMAEFVNRQLGPTGEKTLAGALQTAIDTSGVNAEAAGGAKGNVNILASKTSGLSLATPEALEGSSTQGAPGYLMQADVLAVLGNAATVRSDTFKIRGYGEAVDKAGNVIARAHCEAVVQRRPEYIDPQDKAAVLPDALLSTANRNFGRRFEIMSFRWLSDVEI